MENSSSPAGSAVHSTTNIPPSAVSPAVDPLYVSTAALISVPWYVAIAMQIGTPGKRHRHIASLSDARTLQRNTSATTVP